jgi:Ca-activated chloride channel family protein
MKPLFVTGVVFCSIVATAFLLHYKSSVSANPAKPTTQLVLPPTPNTTLTTDSNITINYTFNGKALSLEAFPQSDYIKADAPGKEFYLYVSLKGTEIQTDKKRPPLNISLVLDRSGSMGGDKILYAKKAVDFVIDQLDPTDVLSIVNYDDVVEISSASMPVKNKESLHDKVSRIDSRGSTNLTGGMLEGYKQVESTKKDGFVNRVLLLSDGLANVGITEPSQIQSIAQKKLREKGIGISAFGVGADYNEELMTNIAEYGGGNYYFIGSPDQIPGIFAKELQGLLQVVAQNTSLKVKFPSEVLSCSKVFGYNYSVSGNEVSINFNDVFAKEEKGVLLKFVTKGKVEAALNFSCALQYTDALSFDNLKLTKEVAVRPTSDEKMAVTATKRIVEESVALFKAAELFDEAMSENDKGNYNGARVKSMQLNAYLDSVSAKGISTQKIVKQKENAVKYYDNVREFEKKSVTEQKMIQKESKSLNYEVKKGR